MIDVEKLDNKKLSLKRRKTKHDMSALNKD